MRHLRLEVKKPEPAAGTGVMVALRPPPDVADGLAVAGGSPADNLHVTLAYLGRVDDLPDGFDAALYNELRVVAAAHQPIAGIVGGLGRFPEGDDGVPVWVPVDAPGLVELRQSVVVCCSAVGTPANTEHGFTPHLTLGYDIDTDPVETTQVTFGDVWLVAGGVWTPIPLGGPETKSAEPTDPGEGAARDGKPVSPDEETVPTEDDPDADPRALSPDGAYQYFADQWGEMEAWFFDDGTSLVGYIRTPQEVIRVDDIDEWSREVDEAGLTPADPPGSGEDAEVSTDDTPEKDLDLGSYQGGLFDFSDLDAKHLPGQHNQRRHGNRYGITAGKRVLRRAGRAAGRAGRAGTGPSAARRQGGETAPGAPVASRRGTPYLGRVKGSPPKPEGLPQKRKLSIEPDPDSRRKFDPDKVTSIEDLWSMNTDDATIDELFALKLRHRGGDEALLDEIDLLHGRKVDQAMREAEQAKKAAAYRRALERDKAEQAGGRGGMAGDPRPEAEIRADLELAARARIQQAQNDHNGQLKMWSKEAFAKMERGDLPNWSDEDLFMGRVPRKQMNKYVSEDLGNWFDNNGWPRGARKAAGVVRDNTDENPAGAWEEGRRGKR